MGLRCPSICLENIPQHAAFSYFYELDYEFLEYEMRKNELDLKSFPFFDILTRFTPFLIVRLE